VIRFAIIVEIGESATKSELTAVHLDSAARESITVEVTARA
jgi:hypothetical protein